MKVRKRNRFHHPKREVMERRFIEFMGCNPDCQHTVERFALVYDNLLYNDLIRPLLVFDYENKGLRGRLLFDRYGISSSMCSRIRRTTRGLIERVDQSDLVQ